MSLVPQTAQVYDMWRRPPGKRVFGGEAIADVEVVRVQHLLAWLRCRENLSRFRPGDTLCISYGNPFDPPRYKCELEEDHGTDLVVRAGYQVSFYGLTLGRGCVSDREPVDVRFLLHGALDQLAQDPPHR